MSTWSAALLCEWDSWIVEGDGHLRLLLAVENHCDMRGAIAAATALCPGVRRIDVFSGGAPDVAYEYQRGAGWRAINLR